MSTTTTPEIGTDRRVVRAFQLTLGQIIGVFVAGVILGAVLIMNGDPKAEASPTLPPCDKAPAPCQPVTSSTVIEAPKAPGQ